MTTQREQFEAFMKRRNPRYQPSDDGLSDRRDWELWKAAQAQQAAVEPTHRTTGFMAPVDRYAVPVLFNPYTGEPRDVRDVQSDPQGFKAMCEAANDCPACILSVIRTKNSHDDNGVPIVSGPEDGRQTWQFKAAKEAWWADFNSGYQPY